MSILLYNTSTEETFKGRSAGCTAIDMHRLLWGKHDFRVKNKDQQAHCSPGAYFFFFLCICVNHKSAPSLPMRPCWSGCCNDEKMKRTFGFIKVPFLLSKVRHLEKSDFHCKITADMNIKPSWSNCQHYQSINLRFFLPVEHRSHENWSGHMT